MKGHVDLQMIVDLEYDNVTVDKIYATSFLVRIDNKKISSICKRVDRITQAKIINRRQGNAVQLK